MNSKIDKIGNTPLVELVGIEKQFSLQAKIFAKLEFYNPGGSIKDRVGKAIIEDAEQKGLLKKDGIVIEATSGNTGIGLALVCKEKGYKAVIVIPDSMSVERRELLAFYGAEIVLTNGAFGMKGALKKAEEIYQNSDNAIMAKQFENPVCALVHYQTTGVEIEKQTQGKADIFVAAVGTGGTLTGVSRYLKEKNPRVKAVAVEPKKSPLLSQGKAGAHGIQGIGANFIPSVLDRHIYDEILLVEDSEAIALSKLVKQTDNLFVGISSGANLAAAITLARREENAGKTIVTLFADGGERYLSVLGG